MTDLKTLRSKLERVKPLVSAGVANIPKPKDPGHRLVGFRLDEETAGLSAGIFMVEAAAALLGELPALLDRIEELEGANSRLVIEAELQALWKEYQDAWADEQPEIERQIEGAEKRLAALKDTPNG